MGVYLLRGETLFYSGRYAAAQAFYTEILDRYGWSEPIAKALAQAFEARGELENARNMFSEIMAQCQGCGARIDPFVKHKYAELSYATGRYTTDILELFLSLAQQVPEKAPVYYQCVSRIYEAQGNAEEAQRFQQISEKLESERVVMGP
jgi:tetratricopeptide (TPR) repeat protein